MIVVATEVTTALPTSAAARWMTSARGMSGGSSLRWRSMLSQTTMPMSDSVPMAMAMPDSDTMLASTPNSFIATKQPSTASGITELISRLLRRCITMSTMTTTTTSVCW